MPMYVVERDFPGAGRLTPQQIEALSRRSCEVLRNMGPEIQWIESFVTENKIYCIYLSPDEETIRKHAELGEFPANSIQEVKTVVDPASVA